MAYARTRRCGLEQWGKECTRYASLRRPWGSFPGTVAISAVAHADFAHGLDQQFRCQGHVAKIVGTNGDDELSGTMDADVIVGRGGDDKIDGGPGRDLVCGDADQPRGNDGNDRVIGGAGSDRIAGGGGKDSLIGATGNDILAGGTGDDRLYGGRGRDRLFGRRGKDRLHGGPDNDRLDGGAATTDSCDGRSGTDGGVRCETRRSIALLRFEEVSLRRFPSGSSTCRLNVVIRNVGDESAKDVEVEGEIRTLGIPSYSSKPVLDGPSEIAPNPSDPIFSNEQYFVDTGFVFPQGDVLRYVLRVHNGGTSVDSTSDQSGIFCKER